MSKKIEENEEEEQDMRLFVYEQEIFGYTTIVALVGDKQAGKKLEAQGIKIISEIKEAEEFKKFCLESLAYNLSQASILCTDIYTLCLQSNTTKESLKQQVYCVQDFIKGAIVKLNQYNEITKEKE